MSKIIILILFFVVGTVHGQNSTLGKYVFQVRIPETKNHKVLFQTGFRLEGKKGIVTALHGLADGNLFSAENENGSAFTNLRIVELDVERDVVLLQNNELAGLPAEGLPSGDLNLTAGQALTSYGHPEGISLYVRALTTAPEVLKTLKNLITPNSSSFFKGRKSPSPDITVINLKVSAGPGESGAPVLNSSNSVVGIINGGLGEGKAEITWAIPLSHVIWSPVSSKTGELERLSSLDIRDQFALSEVVNDPSLYQFPGTRCSPFIQAYDLEHSVNINWLVEASGERMTGASDENSMGAAYYVCTYNFPQPVKMIEIDFGGGTFIANRDGNGGGIMLAVYNGTPNYNSLNNYKESWNKYGGEIWKKDWSKAFKQTSVSAKAETLQVPLGIAASKISIALILIDPWGAYKVNATVNKSTIRPIY